MRMEGAEDCQCVGANGFPSSERQPLRWSKDNGASAGAIAGIMMGVLAGLALTAVLGWFLLRRDSAGYALSSQAMGLTPHQGSEGRELLGKEATGETGSEVDGQGHTPDVQLQAQTVQMGVLATLAPSLGQRWRKEGSIAALNGPPLPSALTPELSPSPHAAYLSLTFPRARSQEDLREPRPPACPPGHGCPHNPDSTIPLHDSRAAVPVYEELLNCDTNIYCQINPKAEVAPYFPQKTWAAKGRGHVRPQSLGRS
nr:uncharacterized protein LOC131274165 [Dasypus novemcinctus]